MVESALRMVFRLGRDEIIRNLLAGDVSREHNALSIERNLSSYTGSRDDVLGLAGMLPKDEYNLSSATAASLEGLELRNVARASYNDFLAKFETGTLEKTRMLKPFHSGLISAVLLFVNPGRTEYQSGPRPEILYLGNGLNTEVSKEMIRATRRVPVFVDGRRSVDYDSLSGIENYLAAVESSIMNDVAEVDGESVKLKKFWHIAPDYAMCLLGIAHGLDVIVERSAVLDEKDRERAEAFAVSAYKMSGLDESVYVSAKLLSLGDPSPLGFSQVREDHHRAFLKWLAETEGKPSIP